MLITQLGKTRLGLLASIQALSDAQLNQQPDPQHPCPAQIIRHVAAVETAIAADILSALSSPDDRVADQAPAALAPLVDALSTPEAGLAADSGPGTRPAFMSKQALVRLLEESRFRHLQRVFNETHERVLAEKSMLHPRFGRISLKNLMDLIWLHDAHQIGQIDPIARIQAAQDQTRRDQTRQRQTRQGQTRQGRTRQDQATQDLTGSRPAATTGTPA